MVSSQLKSSVSQLFVWVFFLRAIDCCQGCPLSLVLCHSWVPPCARGRLAHPPSLQSSSLFSTSQGLPGSRTSWKALQQPSSMLAPFFARKRGASQATLEASGRFGLDYENASGRKVFCFFIFRLIRKLSELKLVSC